MRLNKKSLIELFQLIEKKISAGSKNIGYEDVLNEFVKFTDIEFTSIEEKKWIEIDFQEDYEKAKNLTIN